MRLLLVDNYDSFTYNLAQAFRLLGAEVEVFRNDALGAEDAIARRPDRIVISPGPCTPNEAGISLAVCALAPMPLLGVCLGHQALVQAMGGTISRAPRVMHGKSSPIDHDGKGLFRGLPRPLHAARYHSLIATEVPDCLEVNATAEEGRIPMAVAHRTRPLFGVQFHPESYLTPEGCHLLRNFLELPSR